MLGEMIPLTIDIAIISVNEANFNRIMVFILI